MTTDANEPAALNMNNFKKNKLVTWLLKSAEDAVKEIKNV